jgi:hypothetical protein
MCTYLDGAQRNWHRIELYPSVAVSQLLGSTTRSPQDRYLNMTFDKVEAKKHERVSMRNWEELVQTTVEVKRSAVARNTTRERVWRWDTCSKENNLGQNRSYQRLLAAKRSISSGAWILFW